MTPEERALLETPYTPSYITTEQLVHYYGQAITSQGGIRGEDEHARHIAQGLALKLPGQRGYRP